MSVKVTAKQAAPTPPIRITPGRGVCPIVNGQPDCPEPAPAPQPTTTHPGGIRFQPGAGVIILPQPVSRSDGPAPAVEPDEPEETGSSMPMLYTSTDLGIDINNDGDKDMVSTLLGMLSTSYNVLPSDGESQEAAEARVQAAISAQYPENQNPNLEIVSVFSGDTIIAFIPLNVPLALANGGTKTLAWDNNQGRFTFSASAAPPAPSAGGPHNIQPVQGAISVTR